MAISRSTAARLCSKPEMELVDASLPANVRQLSPGRLRQKVERARKLRDKYRDLGKRQRLESRGKAEPRGSRPASGHDNTDRKAQLFDEVLQRFQKQQERAGTPDTTAGRAGRAAPTNRTGDASRVPKTAGKSAGAVKTRGKNTGARQGGAANAGGAGAGADTTAARKTGAKKTGAKKTGAKKTGAKKTGAKKTGAKKTVAKKTGAKKTGAKKSVRVGRAPAEGAAQPAPPGRPGAAARKGARSRPDSSQQAQPKNARAHTRAAGNRSQNRRDGRS